MDTTHDSKESKNATCFEDADLAARAREILHYEPTTGIFTRKVRTAQRHQVGERADFMATGGSLAGYRRVSFDGKRYMAHRLAWLYVHGHWPSNHIDHVNGDKADNRLSNLRDVSNQINRENMRRPRQDNECGVLGVHAHQGKWRAGIRVKNKFRHLGCFDTPELAHAAYLEAKRRLHRGCTI